MIRFFAAHPTAANIFMAVIVLLGLATLPTLNRETFPEVQNRNVQVTVPYPGASAFEVEEGICQPVEDATDGISYMEEQKCIAKEGIAVFTVKMQEKGDMKIFIDDVKAAIDGVLTFPDDAEEPIVKQLGRTQPVVNIALTADVSLRELKELAEYYRLALLKIPEIPIVEVGGFSTHELEVQIDPYALGQYQLSVTDIADLIRRQAVDLPLGTLTGAHQEFQIRFENSRRSVEELSALVILDDEKGGQIRLGDIATVVDKFEKEEELTEINGKPAAILKITKNSSDDALTIFKAAQDFVVSENKRLPASTRLVLTRDFASIVQDRLSLLLKNGWQGLLLAVAVLFLFFNWRFTFWVTIALPVCFIGGLVIMSMLGISINMISMVALLMAIGILMDDAIVISESIASEYEKSGRSLEASILGVKKVAKGVISSFATSSLLFGSLLFLQGDMGQVMRVLPMVLLSVLTISLMEAFLILPHHLHHALAYGQQKQARWRAKFNEQFERLRQAVGHLADVSILNRYLVLGAALALFMISCSLLPAGILKFKFFPDLEGNILQARIIMPQGTPFNKTEATVDSLLKALDNSLKKMQAEPNGELVKNIEIAFSENKDADENGPHLATITLDLLPSEERVNSLNDLRRVWSDQLDPPAEALSIQFKEPSVGPAGQAISIRLQGNDYQKLSAASWQLQTWLKAYDGVSNIMDDLRLGKPQYSVNLLPGALSSGITAQALASQLRAAYQGVKVSDIYQGSEAYEINVKLASLKNQALLDLESLHVFNTEKQSMPLTAIASIKEQREYSRIARINHIRTVTISGDIDNEIANTNEIINDTKKRFLPQLKADYPELNIALEGEVKNSQETNSSVFIGFILGIVGIYFLLSLQFKNYYEPFIVMLNIPLALIGVIWGHWLMGLDLTMPSMIGFVSLAGVVVNDSILLVEFVKMRAAEGMTHHAAAGRAVRDRFRAIFLTSITTVAGMFPLLSETSLQAQVLVPLVASVVFGMLSSTVLILLVLPATYSILDDLRSS